MDIEQKDINRILDITESFQLPDRLMEVLKNDAERQQVFEDFLKINSDLSYDWFVDYFQENHSNRDKMMQDFTPQSVIKILKRIMPKCARCADICSGTGNLTIAIHEISPEAEYYCVEFSKRAFPLLLFNLCIRNMKAVAVRQDVLTMETFEIWNITPGERFSSLRMADKLPEYMADIVVMNPPYSTRHKWNEKKPDRRFDGYGYPPSSFSDYAFILHGFSMLSERGMLAAIVPHGVLFRGGREKAIREQIIRKGQLDSIIGLPEKLFLNTDIPVCIMTMKRDQAAGGTLFIDASKRFENRGKISVIPDNEISLIVETYRQRRAIERLSSVIETQEMESNEFNLNISRYVDTYEPPPQIDIVSTMQSLAECEIEILKKETELLGMLKELRAIVPDKKAELKKMTEIWEGMVSGFVQTTMRD